MLRPRNGSDKTEIVRTRTITAALRLEILGILVSTFGFIMLTVGATKLVD
jgi:hypothetical protein